MKISRRNLLDALGLASLMALSGCITEALDFIAAVPTLLLCLVLVVFATVGVLVSLAGSGIAAMHLAARRRRSFTHLAVSGAFALAAVGLHAIVTNGFTGVNHTDIERAWRWWPSSVHPRIGWLLVFVGAPLIWFSVAVIEAALAPPPLAGPVARRVASAPIAPLTLEKVMKALVPTLLVLAAYTALMGFSFQPSRPTPPNGPRAMNTATSTGVGAASAQAPPPPAARGSFELLWTASIGEWNHHVSFAPTGEVVATSGSVLQMLDAETGRMLNKVPSCFSSLSGGFGWLDERHAALVCTGEIRRYSLPTLLSTTHVVRTTFDVVGGAVHPKLLIASVVDETRVKTSLVRLFDPPTHKTLVELKIPAVKVGGVAIAPDGVLFALGFDGHIEFREAPSGRVTGELEVSTGSVGALSFSPDGKLLVANTPSSAASIIDVATKSQIRSYEVGSFLTQSRWLTDGSIVATGFGGLYAFFPDGTHASAGVPGESWSGQGLAISADGTKVCAGDEHGTIRMFRLKRH